MAVRPSLAFVAMRQKIGRWLVVLGEFALAQGVGQAAGMLCGLIYVRMMPVNEYAVYALCMTTLAMVSVGSDLGLTGALSYFWRRWLQYGNAIGPKIAAIRRGRVVLFGAALLAGGLSLFTSTRSNTMSIAILVLCFCLMACIAFVQLHSSIGILIMRLEGRQRATYVCESAGSGVRLIGALVMALCGIATAWFGLFIGLLGAFATQAAVKFNNRRTSHTVHKVGRDDWQDIGTYLLPLMPSVAVFMLQEPLVLWLAATRIGSTAVAEVFALGRIGAIYALIGTFLYVVLIPVLSRITDNVKFIKVTAVCLAALCVVSAAALAIVWLFPALPLRLIGHQYAHLQAELLISMATATTTVLASFLILTGRMRGWVKLDPYFALWQLTAIVALCTFWQFDTTAHVLGLNLAIAFSSLICASATFGIGLMCPVLVSISHPSAKDLMRNEC